MCVCVCTVQYMLAVLIMLCCLCWVGCVVVVRLWLCGCACACCMNVCMYSIYDYSLLLKYLNPNLMLLVLGLSTAVLHTLHMHIYLTYIHTTHNNIPHIHTYIHTRTQTHTYIHTYMPHICTYCVVLHWLFLLYCNVN